VKHGWNDNIAGQKSGVGDQDHAINNRAGMAPEMHPSAVAPRGDRARYGLKGGAF
jgi:hypothetical protein